MTTWRWVPFDELTTRELHDLYALRQRVFVVEQRCVYLDVDGHDPQCVHGLGIRDDVLVATARIVPPGVTYADPSIGRVVTAPEARFGGLGRELMMRALDEVERRHQGQAVTIGAQLYLRAFYESLGFVGIGDPYDEDAIMHVTMRRPAPAARSVETG